MTIKILLSEAFLRIIPSLALGVLLFGLRVLLQRRGSPSAHTASEVNFIPSCQLWVGYSQKELLQSSKSILYSLTYWFLSFSNCCVFAYLVYIFQNIIWNVKLQTDSVALQYEVVEWTNRSPVPSKRDLGSFYHWVPVFCRLLWGGMEREREKEVLH